MAKAITAEGKNIAKNIIISVLTTVLGATVIYFLGFNNKKSGLTKLEKEEVTVEAWNTFVAIENIYMKNSISLLRDAGAYGGFTEMAIETEKESLKFQRSIEELIKTEGIDKDLVSVLERRLQNEKSALPVSTKFFRGLDSIIQYGVDNNWESKRLNDTAAAKLIAFGQRTQGMSERAVADIEELSKTLTERYDQPFNLEDFIVIQIIKYKKDPLTFLGGVIPDPLKATGSDNKGGTKASQPGDEIQFSREYLTGKWNGGGESVITLDADGKFHWLVQPGGAEGRGTWKFIDGQLVMYATDKKTKKPGTWMFNLGTPGENNFSMIMATEPFTSYYMTRL